LDPETLGVEEPGTMEEAPALELPAALRADEPPATLLPPPIVEEALLGADEPLVLPPWIEDAPVDWAPLM
jgi:hypothetical protein